MSEKTIELQAEEFAHLDQLIGEYNQHKRDIDLANRIAEKRIEAFKAQIEAWRAEATRSDRFALEKLAVVIADEVLRITEDSDKKSVKLPAGIAGFRKLPVRFTFNGEKADGENTDFVRKLKNDKSEFVYYKAKLDWAAMRKTLKIVEGNVIDARTGAVIEGLTAEFPPDSFYVSESGE